MVAKMKVEGVPEVTRAFNKVEDAVRDLTEAHEAEAQMLLPDVLSGTRKKSGTLASGYRAEGAPTQAKFVNDVVYAGVQEFGWADHNIEPTNAIAQAFASNTERTEKVYNDAIERIAKSAGFDTK